MPIERQSSRLASLALAVALVVGMLSGTALALPDPVDKVAHFAAFSLLMLLLWRATEMPRFALGVALAIGGLDEWRQAYLPGRESDAGDLLADAGGVLFTALLLWARMRPAKSLTAK